MEFWTTLATYLADAANRNMVVATLLMFTVTSVLARKLFGLRWRKPKFNHRLRALEVGALVTMASIYFLFGTAVGALVGLFLLALLIEENNVPTPITLPTNLEAPRPVIKVIIESGQPPKVVVNDEIAEVEVLDKTAETC